MIGTILWFDEKKHFGFILGDDEKKYFLHSKYIKSYGWIPEQGDNVSFECGTDNRGEYAYNVKRQD